MLSIIFAVRCLKAVFQLFFSICCFFGMKEFFQNFRVEEFYVKENLELAYLIP